MPIKGRANKKINRKHKVTQNKLTAWQMYQQDKSMTQIAEYLGVTTGRVSQMLSEEYEAKNIQVAEMAKQALIKEIERIREFAEATFKRSKKDPRMADTLARWLERHDKLLGLYVSRNEVSGPGGSALRMNATQIDMSMYTLEELKVLEALIAKGTPAAIVPALPALAGEKE